jgi:hypothetical protein
MNWSLIILGLVALSSVAIAENSYLVIVPKLLKVGHDNQLSVFIAAASQPVEVKFDLMMGQQHIYSTVTVKSGETRNVTMALPMGFPVGPAELNIIGTGGVRWEEKRDVIVYDNSHVVLVQTSASTYRPGDDMEIRVVVTDEQLMPMETGEVLIEVYDGNLNLVGEFPRIPVRSGISESFIFPISDHCNIGAWLVTAVVGNTTSSVQILVAEPVTPSFDLKAMFQRFFLRTDKMLRGVIEIDDDSSVPLFGRALIAVGPITEQDVQTMMKEQDSKQKVSMSEEWRKWKSQQFEIAGRVEINYDLLSIFNVDLTKALAVQVYIQVTELVSGQERIIQHIIPVFTRDVIYDIRPLEFEAGLKNEFEIISKRPDGKPAKMEDLIVTISMIIGNEQGKVQEEKSVEIKDFYTRGRTDIGFFNFEIPQNCIGVLMTITPLSEDGKMRGYRSHAIPLMPTPRRGVSGAKLSIELLPSPISPVSTDVNMPVVSSQISTVGRTSNFYIQLIPSKPVEKFEPLPMSYVLLTNGRITLTGEFTVQPTRECQSKAPRAITPEEQAPPTCVFNGTLPIQITRTMMPYSTLLVYTFQPSFGFNVAESYRFSVAGLFQNPLKLNATIVPYTTMDKMVKNKNIDDMKDFESLEDTEWKFPTISDKAQSKTRVELSFTGTPDSTVGLNVMEYDGVIQGLSSEITKERVLKYLTTYEQVPIVGMPTMTSTSEQSGLRPRELEEREVEERELDERELDERELEEREWVTDKYSTSTLGSDSTTRFSDMDSRDRNVNMKNNMQYKQKDMVMPTGREFESTTGKPVSQFGVRAVVSEDEEEKYIDRENEAYRVRYPIEKLVFGISSAGKLKSIEGDDAYTTPSLERFYGDSQSRRPSSTSYRRRDMKQLSQYDVSVDNDYVVATSMPLVLKSDAMSASKVRPVKSERQGRDDVDDDQHGETQESRTRPQYGTSSWYEKMNSKLSLISQEALTFMQSGLSIVTDFPSLRVPVDMRRTNLTKLFARYRKQSTLVNLPTFDMRDEARQLLAEYLEESDLSMITPPILLEEQARIGYYRSIFFNTTRIGSQGTGKVVLPQTKPYSTWLATGFSLNAKSGLSVAQPIRLPTNQGLYILGDFPEQVQMGERILLTWGINNYLGKDLSNVMIRIRASDDFDLYETTQPERLVSTSGKDYTITIPSFKSLGVETRNIILVPKRAGVVQIILEVESEFGGDYEVLTSLVRESGIERLQYSTRFLDLTAEKKYGPFSEKITQSPFLRSVQIAATANGIDRFVERYTTETNSLVGIDRAIIRLWRLLGVRRYLNETSHMESPLWESIMANISTSYQKLQLYGDYDGSYSFISDQDEQQSSLYLTSLAFGALISPYMPVRDNVTINRTLTYILSQQREDGSFDDAGPCFHYRFCSGEFRREALTALVLYSLTHDNVSDWWPEYVHHQLYKGEQSPVARAFRYLESRLDAVKPCLLTTTLLELTLSQWRFTSEPLRQKIWQNVRSRQLTVVPEDNSKYLKNINEKMTYDDELLVNALMVSLYANYGDVKTTSDIARWIVEQIEKHPYYDTVLDAVFHTEAWLKMDWVFRQRYGMDKVSIVVDITTDNGQKQQFKIDASNMYDIQRFYFTLPVNQITYTVSGFGVACVYIRQVYIEKQQQMTEPTPFQLTNEWVPMPWMSEIKAKTCVTYTPTPRDHLLAKDSFNRTVIVEVQLPSGMRMNLRQIGFFLSRVPNAMYFTYHELANTINFFLNVPSTVFGKPICLEWPLERLSWVTSWAPVHIRAYDYLQQDYQLIRLMPVQLQPNLLGYSFVDAVHKARPSLEQLSKMQEQKPTRV